MFVQEVGTFEMFPVCVNVPYRLGAVDVSGQADDEVMCDGVHQVSEAGVAVQDVVQRSRLHAQVLHTRKTRNQ